MRGTSRRNGASAPSAAHSAPPAIDSLVHNVAEIVKIEQRDRLAMSRSDHIADWFTGLSGSMPYVWLHVAWFSLWIIFNLGWFSRLGLEPFDPFPFGLLTMIVSLEAIFLSTFVLISQNRQALQADRRAKVDLQVDVIAEQEITKIVQMLAELQEHLGVRHHDPELTAMRRPTHISQVADAIDEAEKQIDPRGAQGPDSAVDTEA
jgi:uncharacterized membrane protein